jgi:hypothetical protein
LRRVPCGALVEPEGDYTAVESVCAKYRRCRHDTESYGTSDASVRRCPVLLRQECRNDEQDYYFEKDEPASPTAPPWSAS